MCRTAMEFAAAGHTVNGKAAVCLEDGTDKWVLKPLDSWELQIYESLERDFKQDPVRAFIPQFYGTNDKDGPLTLRLENLLQGMVAPHVMDIKLGKRTFLFSASENDTPRADLFQKLLKSTSDLASTLNSTEMASKAVTKRRYMELRDAATSSASLGFRVQGTVTSRGRRPSKQQPRPLPALTEFAQGMNVSAWTVVKQLTALRDAMETSSFVWKHELIGTSVLLVADAATGKCRVGWIDFAKARVSEGEKALSHRAPCAEDSQEDGMLTGLDNLIEVWMEVAQNESFEESLSLDEDLASQLISRAGCGSLKRSMVPMVLESTSEYFVPVEEMVRSPIFMRSSERL